MEDKDVLIGIGDILIAILPLLISFFIGFLVGFFVRKGENNKKIKKLEREIHHYKMTK